MKKLYGRVVLITGASSGIGKNIAKTLCERGYRVYGTSRKQDDPEMIMQQGEGFIRMIKLDVCSDTSVSEAVGNVLEMEGSIDILINNAGFGIAGAVEETAADEAYRQFNTNFFGAVRMCNHVLPVMRKQNRGLIINISSVAGLLAIPFQSMYSASKYALEAMTEALRIEVKPYGIKAVLVEPGDTRTSFTGNRQYAKASNGNSPYKERFTKSISTMVKDETNGPDPRVVTNVIVKLLERNNPPIRVAVGFPYKTVVLLKRILPSRLVEFILSILY
jgi:short-subunit dehydrogenase